jgi:hypothetical protein
LLAADPPPTKAGLAGFAALKARTPNFDPAALGADAAIVDAGVKKAKAHLATASVAFEQGWQYPKADLGNFGDDIGYRAIVSVAAIAALVPEEAMYLRAQGDDGVLFHGDGLYRLSLPTALPVDAFWSLTMYEATADGQFFFTENPIDRFSIGDRQRRRGCLDLANRSGWREIRELVARAQGRALLHDLARLPAQA